MTTYKKNIGILGGTFDPPHEGHLNISMQAINKLKLDEIWWVISLSNPLKKKEKISNFSERYSNAKKYVNNRKIIVSNIEEKINSPYTLDLLEYLTFKFPKQNFVWILGVDNLKNFHKWKNWKRIFYKVPIAIFDRPNYSLNIIRSKCMNVFKKNRVPSISSEKFKHLNTPCWIFLYGWGKQTSSSKIKNQK